MSGVLEYIDDHAEEYAVEAYQKAKGGLPPICSPRLRGRASCEMGLTGKVRLFQEETDDPWLHKWVYE